MVGVHFQAKLDIKRCRTGRKIFMASDVTVVEIPFAPEINAHNIDNGRLAALALLPNRLFLNFDPF